MDNKTIYLIIDNKIDTLDLSNKVINQEDFNKLLNALRFNNSIKNINLSNFRINHFNVNYIQLILILKSLQSNNLLETLDVSENYLNFIYYPYDNLDLTNTMKEPLLSILTNTQKELIQSYFNSINKIINFVNETYNIDTLISYLQKFKRLNLSNNRINMNTDFLIQLLKNNVKLEKLDISNNDIINSDWTYILKENSTLKELINKHNEEEKSFGYKSKTLDLFVNIIKNSKSLVKLSVTLYYENKFKVLNKYTFNELNCSSLKTLTICGGNHNHYPLLGFKHLFNTLKTNTTLTKLSIVNYCMDDKLTNDCLYETLKYNKTIQKLQLTDIIITKTNYINFIKSLYNSSITKLSLIHIVVDVYTVANSDILDEIACLINNNTSLQYLKLYDIFNIGYFITKSKLLVKSLKETKTLKKVYINNCIEMNKEDIDKIKENKNIELIFR